MKLTFIIIVSFICSTYSVAQEIKEAQVPAAVVTTFKSKYPGDYVYEWEFKKKEKRYEAEFMNNGVKLEASFDPHGTWLWTSHEIENGSLPQPVTAGLNQSEYSAWKIDDVEQRETPSGLTYQVEVENGKKEAVLYFGEDGSLKQVVNKK
ncbi:MAG TPA: PepSY-like domain-containing protein [Cyclobacteriaceae bacterium]|nr:PepSY-like domain-containing protein [Cyclobacteriaceae bacterium]